MAPLHLSKNLVDSFGECTHLMCNAPQTLLQSLSLGKQEKVQTTLDIVFNSVILGYFIYVIVLTFLMSRFYGINLQS